MMWGPDGSLYYPSTLSPWCRQRLGWVEPYVVTTSGEYPLMTAQYSGDVARINLSEGEYLLIENRQKRFMDAILPGDGGLLIWHIDENMGSSWMSRPGWPLQDGWPGNGNHYTIALLSPDTRYDMEREANFGDADDFWTSGMSLGPGPGEQEARVGQVSMYPNTDSYSGGNIETTDIRIWAISDLGDYMTFRVEIPGSPWVSAFSQPTPTDEPTWNPTTSPTELPTDAPSKSPTGTPTKSPTFSPTVSPTARPTASPTANPTKQPTASPTAAPTLAPTPSPSATPTSSAKPSSSPTVSSAPSEPPTDSPTRSPTDSPTPAPVAGPYDYETQKKTVIRRPFDYYFNNR